MTWLRSLNELDVSDLRAVGHKAYHLSVLKQRGLPVAHGGVLTAAAWHHSLGQMTEGQEPPLFDLAQGVHSSEFRALQQTSQRWQQALRATPRAAPTATDWQLGSGTLGFVTSAWMLRASLWLGGSVAVGRPCPAADGLLPAQIEADFDLLPQVLPQFWSQALTARCLVVWQAHSQQLHDLSLATLVMPVYPALLSGTLTLAPGQVTLAVVEGLGLALSQGEAVPARCWISQGRVADVVWAEGFQERRHQLMPASKYRSRQQAAAQPVQMVQRDRPELVTPLNSTQLAQLVALGNAAQQALGTPSLRLEWLLYPSADPAQPALVITQADPRPPPGPPPPRLTLPPARQPVASQLYCPWPAP